MIAAWPPVRAARPDAGHHRHRAAPSRRPRAVATAGALLAGALWVGAVSMPTSEDTWTAVVPAWMAETGETP